ncbi:hypothetical protein F3Y22_tig00110503pilonHSYRG00520 [Hibiscus syriacus]|uniref:Uncharacterized protein n=1 Tax=Hibiscus syriacus TaxID=106335 RepID=A0A6A3AGM2_HIBSY|nr:hypothetical protein F3Y22_tig00110503pilonHSYRG00520 [Hibiscus syriacus]
MYSNCPCRCPLGEPDPQTTNRLRHKILGTPTREEIKCMNSNYTEFKFPQIKAHPWHKLEALAHLLFDDLRDPNVSLPNGRTLHSLFNFTAQELAGAPDKLRQRLIPEHSRT